MQKDEYTVTLKVRQPLSQDMHTACMRYPGLPNVEDALKKVFEDHAESWRAELGEDAKISIIDVQIDEEAEAEANRELVKDYTEVVKVCQTVLLSNSGTEQQKKDALDLLLKVFGKCPEIFSASDKVVSSPEIGTQTIPRDVYNRIVSMISLDGGKIQNRIKCIKEYRTLTGVGLKEAKDVVDAIVADMLKK